VTPAPISMAEVLARTAAEVARCRAIVLDIEDAVHSLSAAGDLPPKAPVRKALADLQSIDLLDQRLDDLARWLAALAPHCSDAPLPAGATQALFTLRLADLRAALAGGATATPGGNPTELF
jgi:hypothetical protein